MIGPQDETLVVNVGSSSLKFRVYRGNNILEDKNLDVEKSKSGFDKALVLFYDNIKNYENIKKIAYRMVCGGNFKSPVEASEKILNEIRKKEYLYPLHAKRVVEIVKFLKKKIKAEHILCFDSQFHKTMPPITKNYPIPMKLQRKYGITRYGFHGIAHESLLKDAERFSGKKYKRAITCQLGSGVSICAIKNGKSIDTTMGFTPLEGLMMSTRSGNIDPAIIFYLDKKGIKPSNIKNILEKDSGLKGVAGTSNMGKVSKSKSSEAKLAFEMFAYQVKKVIGAYAVVLGGIDVVVLGGGMSKSPKLRKKILEGLEMFGIRLNSKKVSKKAPVKISSAKTDVFAFRTDEQRQMFEIVKRM